ncbi:UDP-2,4-diacetamido-2,4,6-trideoxy-beta-L-altropyranose hydrolase [Chitinimonas arctica]|uniref:UDP-2,4-diacetamido-2,4, 6-trideoxy-beta-L-altropyranose hydrolase n=1 Tax=Chitinimonas arctica TaxID=2594795 RepID=A0A516SL69_9NEIS|nr:UDP-2,4-diacetamido-2,4,6-trideoxy-beta-L-altropyranose hydrolase [Chitinimonas arctica]QDQ28904.1 UDP-2,4-diacetamido-2,4,6-trideoxy-beta-L-altropyranose hydrolase [Chitinimonas arctica]
MKVLIRADASVAIGSGHVARCLTLAKVLRLAGAQPVFACRALPGHALAVIAGQGFETVALPAGYKDEMTGDIEAALPWRADLDALQAALPGQRFDWLLVDHYGLGAAWQTGARSLADRIAVVDDLANRPHDADLLLNQNLNAEASAYAGQLPSTCRLLLGPRHALLRPEFNVGPVEIAPRAKRLLVSFGGADAQGETFKVMTALADLDELEVDFVAGAANPAWPALTQALVGREHWRLHRHVDDFAGLMARADLFIGAGGGTSWERAALGLPSICIAIAANQVGNAERLALAGAHLYLGQADAVTAEMLRAAVSLLAGNVGLRHSLAARSRALVDGKGAARVAAALLTGALRLRPATSADAQLLFDGRNAAEVRRWSLNDAAIDWDGHLAWLQRSLANAERALLVAEAPDGPVGVLRYDRIEPQRAEVSIYLLAGREGRGWGQALLAAGDRWIAEYWPGLQAIAAVVKPANVASLKLFQALGYRQQDCHFERTPPF